jgi:hypothetical protein
MPSDKLKQRQMDSLRKNRLFHVRLKQELALKLQHYMKDQNMNANQALIVIISKFFRNY